MVEKSRKVGRFLTTDRKVGRSIFGDRPQTLEPINIFFEERKGMKSIKISVCGRSPKNDHPTFRSVVKNRPTFRPTIDFFREIVLLTFIFSKTVST